MKSSQCCIECCRSLMKRFMILNPCNIETVSGVKGSLSWAVISAKNRKSSQRFFLFQFSLLLKPLSKYLMLEVMKTTLCYLSGEDAVSSKIHWVPNYGIWWGRRPDNSTSPWLEVIWFSFVQKENASPIRVLTVLQGALGMFWERRNTFKRKWSLRRCWINCGVSKVVWLN